MCLWDLINRNIRRTDMADSLKALIRRWMPVDFGHATNDAYFPVPRETTVRQTGSTLDVIDADVWYVEPLFTVPGETTARQSRKVFK